MNISNGFVDLFVKTTSEAAYASSLLKGKGGKIAADQAAVDKMRLFLNNIPMKGKIVIGEGEMDEAPMLYINELVGTGTGEELDLKKISKDSFISKKITMIRIRNEKKL